MMKVFKAVAAAVLALALLIQLPAGAYAQTQNADTKDYISEVKIAMGGGAEEALEGYTILSDENGKAVDLNKDAGGGWGSQGDRRVFLGYRSGSYNWDEINRQGSEDERKAVMKRQERDAIYDIIVTRNEPYHAGGIVSQGIYYTPASEKSLNSGCSTGAEIYVYYATPYYSQAYNKRTNQSTASPETVFSGFITRLAAAEKDRVPYNLLQEEDMTYTMKRSNGRVKPAGQITGGFLESTYEVGDVYLRK